LQAAELAAARLQTPEDIDVVDSGVSEDNKSEAAEARDEFGTTDKPGASKIGHRQLQLPPIGEGSFDAAAHSSRRESMDYHSPDGSTKQPNSVPNMNESSGSNLTVENSEVGDVHGKENIFNEEVSSDQHKLPPLSPRQTELDPPPTETNIPVEADSSNPKPANDLNSNCNNNQKSAEQVAEERAVLEKKIATARKKLRRAGPDDPGLAEGMQAAIDGLESKLAVLNLPVVHIDDMSSNDNANGGGDKSDSGAVTEADINPALVNETGSEASTSAGVSPSLSLLPPPLSDRSTTPPLARIQRTQFRRMPRGLSKPLSRWEDEVLLRKAAGDGDLAECHRLLGPKSITDVNAPDESGGQRTALHCAADNGHAAVVKYLCMEAQANLDPKTAPYGHTPLHLAAENNCWPVVQALLAAGANATATNLYGETARDVAASNGHTKVLEALPDISTGRLSTGRSSSLKKSQSKKVRSFRGSQRMPSNDSAGSPPGSS